MSGSTQPSIFLSFEGVPGEVVLSASTVPPGPAKDWVQLLSCRLDANINVQGRAMSGGSGTRIDFGGQAPPVRITKLSDAATVGLMREVLAGKTPRKAVIVFVRTDATSPTEYLRYDLQDCAIVGFDIDSTGDDRAVETFSILYKRLTMTAFGAGQGAKGAQSTAVLLNGA